MELAGAGEQRAALKEQLRQIQAQREADETEAAALDDVLSKIAVCRRDRDAGMSEEIERYRVTIDEALAEGEELVVAVGRLWALVQAAELGEGDPRLHAARRAADEDAAAALRTLAAAVNAEDVEATGAGAEGSR